jgi:hypothetical protein
VTDRFDLTREQRDKLLRNKGLIKAYERHEPHFRALTETAFALASRALESTASALSRPAESLIPVSADCVSYLNALLNNDKVWGRASIVHLGHNTGQFVQQITLLMAEYLVDIYWATLVVRR